MRVKIITSFNEDLWTRYAKSTFDSWVRFLSLDEGSVIEPWILGSFPRGLPLTTTNGTPFKYKMLETQSPAWCSFYERFAEHPKPQTQPGNEYKFNFVPFSIKVFALAEGALSARDDEKFDYVLWLDADVMLHNYVTCDYLKSLIGSNHLAWLDRGSPWHHGETGFILVANKDNALDIFLQQANLYGAGQLFYFAEWHDAFVFTSLVRLKEYMDFEEFKVVNLNKDMESKHKNGLYPFETSLLNSHMTHFKGNTKEKISGTND